MQTCPLALHAEVREYGENKSTSSNQMFYFSVLNLQNLTDLSQKKSCFFFFKKISKKKFLQYNNISCMANPELHPDAICRHQQTVILWQQAPRATSLGRYYKAQLKFKIHSDKWAKRGGTETSALQADVQITDSVGRWAACQTGHSLVTRAALGPRISTRCLPDEHFLDLLHQRCATAMSEW